MAVPTPTNQESVIVVRVAGERSGTATAAVTPLAGVELALWRNGAPVGTSWSVCVSDTQGNCSFVVPNTGSNGANRDVQFEIRIVTAPANYTPITQFAQGSGTSLTTTNYRFTTGTTLRGGQTYVSGTNFMQRDASIWSSSGYWVVARQNPPAVQQCGLDIALVLDLSGSVQGSIGQLTGAADSLVNSLVGTSSRMSLFTFSTTSPAENGPNPNPSTLVPVATQAQANAFRALYAGVSAGGATNWDAALWSVAQANQVNPLDVVVVITDGSPTNVNGDPSTFNGTGQHVEALTVDYGAMAANTLRASGVRVLAIGVGSGVSGNGGLNLQAISGPVAFTGSNYQTADYAQTTNYAQAANMLRQMALGLCQSAVQVTKMIIPAGGTINDAYAAPAGWQFSATPVTSQSTVTPSNQSTTSDGTGTVSFGVTPPAGQQSAVVRITETQQSGYTLHQVAGANAVCTNTSTGANVPVTNSGAFGFDVAAVANAPVNCIVYNAAIPTGEISWSKVDGTDTSVVLGGSTWDLVGPQGTINIIDNTGQPGYTGRDTDPTPGVFRVIGLPLGNYTLAETAAPTGYSGGVLVSGTLSASQLVLAFGPQSNTRLPGEVTWTKVDETGAAIGPSTWTLTGPNGTITVVDNGANDADGALGAFRVTGLPWGTYVLAETSPPPGYELPVGLTYQVSIGATTLAPSFGAITNTKQLGQLSWTKVDTDGVTLLGGSTWNLTGPDGYATVVEDNTGQDGYTGLDTDETAGQFIVADLAWGEYTLSEATAPVGYTLLAGSTDATISATTTAQHVGTFVNVRATGGLTWAKTDVTTGSPLAGSVWTIEGNGVQIVVTDNTGDPDYTGRDTDPAAGSFHVEGLAWGEYTLTETTAPSGYVLDTTPRPGTVSAADLTFDFGTITNAPITGSVAWSKVDATTGAFLAGSAWTLAGDAGLITIVDNGEGDENPEVGQLLVTNLPIGSYSLTETTAPTGYQASAASIPVQVTAESPVVLLGGVPNSALGGTVSWSKSDATTGALIGGSEWLLTGPNGLTVAVTDNTGAADYDGADSNPAAGEFSVAGLAWGQWSLSETAAPAGYVRTPGTLGTVTLSAATLQASFGTGSFPNARATGTLEWTKVDEDGATLLGGSIWSLLLPDGTPLAVEDNVGQSGYTGRDFDPAVGVFRVDGLSWGAYTLTESVAPVGYTVSPASYPVTIGAGTLVVQVGALVNTRSLGQLSWTKIDTVTSALLGGATFSVTGPTGEILVEDNVGQSGYTGRDTDPRAGAFTVAGLAWGAYSVSETIAPNGYVLSSQTLTGTIGSGTLSLAIGTVGNTPITGTVSWSKLDATSGDALAGSSWRIDGPGGPYVVVDNGALDANATAGALSVSGLPIGSYTLTETSAPTGYVASSTSFPFQITAATTVIDLGGVSNVRKLGAVSWSKVDTATGLALGGAVFALTTPDGTVVTVPDNTGQSDYLGPDTNPAAGEFTVEGLAWGQYSVQESTPPYGYALTDQVLSGTIHAEHLIVGLGTIGNDALLGTVSWSKVDAESDATIGGSVWTLVGPTDEITVVDNGAFDTNPAAGQLTVVDLPLGEYTLTEVTAPAGYVRDGTTIEFTLTPDPLAITLDAVENERQGGEAIWSKVDAETGALLGGAVFELTLPDGSTIEVVDDTGDDPDYAGLDEDDRPGQFRVSGLEWGDYALDETEAPYGYERDEESHTGTIGASALQLQFGAIENTAQLGAISWSKTDSESGDLIGGSEWLLVGPDGAEYVVRDNGVLDENLEVGVLTVSQLPLGAYTLTEQIAPEGYTIAGDPVRFTVVPSDVGQWLDPIENDRIPGALVWQKADAETGEFLADSAWTLHGPDGATIDVTDNTGQDDYVGADTDESVGEFRVEDIEWGEWELEETSAPAGYQALTERLGPVTIGATAPEASFGDGPILNDRIPGTISWTKVDGDGAPLAGSSWLLEGDGWSAYLNDNGLLDLDPADGAIEVGDLPWGEYSLQETGAPYGYRLLEEPIEGIIVGPESLEVHLGDIENVAYDPSISLDKVATVDGVATLGSLVTYTFTITNTGDTDLVDVTLTDDLPGLSPFTWGAWPGPVGELEPGESVVATATLTATAAHVAAGAIHNTAVVVGTVDLPVAPAGPAFRSVPLVAASTPAEPWTVTDSDSALVPVIALPTIPGLPSTGVDLRTIPLGIAALLLLLAGGVLIRRRAHSAD